MSISQHQFMQNLVGRVHQGELENRELAFKIEVVYARLVFSGF